MTATTVSLSNLQRACATLLDRVAASDDRELQLVVDAYWQLSPDARFRVYEPPSGLTVGHVSDDVTALRQALADRPDDPAEGLRSLAHVLLAVAATVDRDH